jgi:hypothetical protein
VFPWQHFLISAPTGQHLRKILQRLSFGFQNGHFFFGSLSAASILRFEELTQRLCILMCFTTRFFSDHASNVTEMLSASFVRHPRHQTQLVRWTIQTMFDFSNQQTLAKHLQSSQQSLSKLTKFDIVLTAYTVQLRPPIPRSLSLAQPGLQWIQKSSR